ncbi:hypothetical protein [Pelagibius sp. Alg239-R121]|nr:hypothetical protein [Pelagibius sp. Alg239-R121]
MTTNLHIALEPTRRMSVVAKGFDSGLCYRHAAERLRESSLM